MNPLEFDNATMKIEIKLLILVSYKSIFKLIYLLRK